MPEPTVWDEDLKSFTHGQIAEPSGGVTVDVEARAAIVAILDALKSAGLIAQD